MRESPVNIYALGGLGEVGKNTYCFENDHSLILVDAGVRFGDPTLPGVDYVIPDYTYLKNNRSKIRALFITHGHEDHIGGIPFLLRAINIPIIYAPRLAAALIRHKLEDAKVHEPPIVEYDENSIIKVADDFVVSFFRVTHSIPDSFGLCIDTSQGRIVETGDFKIDLTPVGPTFQLDRVTRLGTEGVDLLMADSTNAELEGYTPSESNVRAGVEKTFDEAEGRIIVSTFSSNINRIQQVIEVALAHGRKVCILGRSMIKAISISREYGYIKIPDNMIIEESEIRNYKNKEVCIICTGSQGEPRAVLSRLVSPEGNDLRGGTRIYPGDTVVFSSNPIPGNGDAVAKLVNEIVKIGASVNQNSIAFCLHSSGHPSRQELRLMQRLVRPKYFMPVHGEHRMLKLHGELAVSTGLNPSNVFICENGDNLVLANHKVTRGAHIPADDVYLGAETSNIDGLTENVLTDREIMKNDGMVAVIMTINPKKNALVIPPQIYSSGFNADANSHVIRHSAMYAEKAVRELMTRRVTFSEIKSTVRVTVGKYIERTTSRKPMIIPVIMSTED